MAHAGGRPPKYTTAIELWKVADEFFKLCDKHKQLPEKAGLCLALGITRETYNQYKKGKFSDVLKRIELYIESNWVRRLNAQAATGAIFYLKNAFREHYKDRIESDVTLKTPKPLLDVLHNNRDKKDK